MDETTSRSTVGVYAPIGEFSYSRESINVYFDYTLYNAGSVNMVLLKSTFSLRKAYCDREEYGINLIDGNWNSVTVKFTLGGKPAESISSTRCISSEAGGFIVPAA